MSNQLKVIIALVGVMAFCCAEIQIGDWQGSLDAQLRYRPQDSTTAVVTVRKNSFSEEAGLLPGDLILAVDGVNVTGASFEEVLAAVRGPVGTMARVDGVARGTRDLVLRLGAAGKVRGRVVDERRGLARGGRARRAFRRAPSFFRRTCRRNTRPPLPAPRR